MRGWAEQSPGGGRLDTSDFVKDRVGLELHLSARHEGVRELLMKHLASFVLGEVDVGIEVLLAKNPQEESSGAPPYASVIESLARDGRGMPPVPLVLIGVAA